MAESKGLTTLMKLTSLAILFVAFTINAVAQKVEKFTVEGKEYYGTKAIPQEIVGLYQFEKVKDPIVEINKDGTGKFQVHNVKAYPVEYWIETDAAGKVQKRKSETNSNYQVILILKYGSNGVSGWKGSKAGTFDRIDVTLAYDMGYAIILGERFRKL